MINFVRARGTVVPLVGFAIAASLFFYTVASGQGNQVVYEDEFNDNTNGWRLWKSKSDEVNIQQGHFYWNHRTKDGNSIYQYINQLDHTADFTAQLEIRIKKIGSEAGLMIGGVDQENAIFFTQRGMQYRIFSIAKGKITIITDYTTNLHLRPDKNELKVVGKKNMLQFLSNNDLLTSSEKPVFAGKAYGIAVWDQSEIEINRFQVSGKQIPINLVPQAAYPAPPEPLGEGVNTGSGEFTPVVTADGKGLYFTRTYYPGNKGGVTDYQDVYYSEYKNGSWQPASNLGTPVNNESPNAVCAVSPDGNTLLLMNTYDNKGEAYAMGLSISNRTASGWAVPKTLRVKNYYNKSAFNEYYLTNNNKVLLLALQRDDSYGTRDIYVSFIEQDGAWSVPQNLGPIINTPGTELSPFLAADGVTLYFSSNGHPGYGKNDIFISRRLDDSWTNWTVPQNMGLPLNSRKLDAYYTIPASGEYAYFVSESSTFGNSDIFRVLLPDPSKPRPVVLIKGRVINSRTLQPIATSITYRNLDTDKEQGNARSNPVDGSYQITLPYNASYSFFASKEGFYSVRDSLKVLDLKVYTEITRDIYLTPLEVGDAIPLKNVFFVRSEATLLPASFPELDRLAFILKDQPGMEIEIFGHTDNVGDPEKNIVLSQQRVERVKQYLVNHGVAEKRISGKGFGGSRPIADNLKEETRRLNRRVEFKITKI